MNTLNKSLAIVLSCAVPLAACTTTHFAGDYHPSAKAKAEAGDSLRGIGRSGERATRDVAGTRRQEPILAYGSSWQFLWGTLDTGDFDVDSVLSREVARGVVKDMSVEDQISILGIVCWIFTVGIFSHHHLIVRGHVEPEKTTAPAPSTPSAG